MGTDKRCGAVDIGDVCTRDDGHDGYHSGDHYEWRQGERLCWSYSKEFNEWCGLPNGHDSFHLGDWRTWTDPVEDDEDDRHGFWVSWSRLLIFWVFGVIAAAVVLPMLPTGGRREGVTELAVFVGGAYLLKLIAMAVGEVRDERRERV